MSEQLKQTAGMEAQPINDELMMPCAQCCRKHLRAAIAYYADTDPAHCYGPSHGLDVSQSVSDRCLARAIINLVEYAEGYGSHREAAIGFLVRAEEALAMMGPEDPVDAGLAKGIREIRLGLDDPGRNEPFVGFGSSDMSVLRGYMEVDPYVMYSGHVLEAEREFPEIRDAVDPKQFEREGMSPEECRQAVVNYRLAQLRWLDENVFGTSVPKEKGEEKMAKATKKPAPAKKGGCKGACKGGKSKK